MPHFRKLFDLPTARLSRADVRDLGRLISDGLVRKPFTDDFSLSYGDATYQDRSVDDLLCQDLPHSVDMLSFRVVGWTEDDKIDRHVTLQLSRTSASCEILSYDEVWFKGKIIQIEEFFAKHKPWYGKIGRNGISALLGLLIGSFIPVFWLFLSMQEFMFAAVVIITALFFIMASFFLVKGRLFPHADIHLCDKPRRLSREVLMVIFTGIMAVAVVATVLIQIMEMVWP